MKIKGACAIVTGIVLTALLTPCLQGATLDESIAKFAKYSENGSAVAAKAVEDAVYRASNDPKAKADLAARLIALIESKTATADSKNFTCQLLPLIANTDAVKPLTALMGDPKTADAARGALQKLSSPLAAKALREAMGKASGADKIGLINSVGARKDTEAVTALKALLTDKNAEVAAAATAALGEIGNAQAVAALSDSKLKPTYALLDALLQCAETNPKSATNVYKRLSASDDDNWKWAGLTGLSKSSGADALAPLLEVLDSDNTKQHRRALSLLTTLPGKKTTAAMTARLAKSTNSGKVLLLGALARRGDRTAGDTVAGFLGDKDAGVRTAAIEAIGKLGGAKNIEALAKIAATDNNTAARASLATLPGKDVDAALIAGMSRGDPATRAELIAAATARGTKGAAGPMLTAAKDSDPAVRIAACKGLAQLAGKDELPKIVELLAGTSTKPDRQGLSRAILATGRRIDDSPTVSSIILVGLKSSNAESTAALLKTLTYFGASNALASIVERVDSKETVVSEAALRALTNWPDAAACGPLLKVVSDTKNAKHRTLAMRGYLRLAPASKKPADALAQISRLVKTPADKRLMLSAAGQAASTKSLDIAISLLGDADVKLEAAHAAATIAMQLASASPADALAAMKKVRATNPPPAVLAKADAVEKLAKDSPRRPPPDKKTYGKKTPNPPEKAPKPLPTIMPEPKDPSKTNVLIVTGVDYPGHKWKKTAPVLADILAKDKRLEVRTVADPHQLSSPTLHKYDVLVVHFMDWKVPSPNQAARENFSKFIKNGGGAVFVHFACGAWQDWPGFGKIAGKAWNPKMRGHDPHGSFTVEIVKPEHEITKGMKDFKTVDELYTCLDGKTPIEIIAHSKSKVDKKMYAMAFVLKFGKGRVFHSPLGHDVRAFKAPGVRELFRRGTAWAGKLKPAAAK